MKKFEKEILSVLKSASEISSAMEQNSKAVEACASNAAILFCQDIDREIFVADFFESASASILRTSFAKKASLLFNGIAREKADARGRVIQYCPRAFSRGKQGEVTIIDANPDGRQERLAQAKEILKDSALLRFDEKEETDTEKAKRLIKALYQLKIGEDTIVKLYRELLPAKKPVKGKGKNKNKGK